MESVCVALEMRAAMKVKRVSLVFACVGVLKAVLIRIVGLIVIMKTVYVSVQLQLTLAVGLQTHALEECASVGMKTHVAIQMSSVTPEVVCVEQAPPVWVNQQVPIAMLLIMSANALWMQTRVPLQQIGVVPSRTV